MSEVPSYEELLANFPPELRGAVHQLVEYIRRQFDPTVTTWLEVKDQILDALAKLQDQFAQAQTAAQERWQRVEQVLQRLAEAQARSEERMDAIEAALKRLAEAQARTEERVGSLEAAMQRLAEAQARTEERVKELAEAQARTEERVGSLEAAMQRLAEAQARTEERVGSLEAAVQRLAEAQARTDERVKELAEAQARTEERLDRLEAAVQRLEAAQERTDRAVRALARQVGGLSETVGGDIEDIAYIVLHTVLQREFGWQVQPLERVWKKWNGRIEEINVFGPAIDPKKPTRRIWIVGEAKHNLTIRDVERFARQVERARRHVRGEIFPVCFCYRARPEVQERVRHHKLRLVFSYGKLV